MDEKGSLKKSKLEFPIFVFIIVVFLLGAIIVVYEKDEVDLWMVFSLIGMLLFGVTVVYTYIRFSRNN